MVSYHSQDVRVVGLVRRLSISVGAFATLTLVAEPGQAQSCTGTAADCGNWSPIYHWGAQINPAGCTLGTDYTEISHAALIPIGQHAGKVVQWRQSLLPPAPCAISNTTEVWVFNPNNPGVLQVVNQQLSSDIFCSGLSWDRNGRLLVAGGFAHGATIGALDAFRFDPRALGMVIAPVGGGTPGIQGAPWTVAFQMSMRHYYPAVFGLDRRDIDSTGEGCAQFFIPGGSQMLAGGPPLDGSIGTEVWQAADPAIPPTSGNPWLHSLDSATGGSQSPAGPVELYAVVSTTPATEPRLDSYPHPHPLADPLPPGDPVLGSILIAHDIETTTDPTATQPNSGGESWVMKPPAANVSGCWQMIRTDNSEPEARERHYVPSVRLHTLLSRNRVLAFGGSQPLSGGGFPWTSHGIVQEFDFQGGAVESGTWKPKASLIYPRLFHNAVVTPIGHVLILGGDTVDTHHGGQGSSCTTALLTPEFYDPGTGPNVSGASYPLAPDPTATPRRYHHVAVLLLDGRVVLMGGHQRPTCNDSEHTGQIYEPPYLFNGTQPVIESAPGTVSFGSGSFDIDATLYHHHVEKVVLLRPAATTHHQDFDQLYIELEFSVSAYQPGDSRTLTVQAPHESLGPPGYYTLWVVESKTASATPGYRDLVPSAAKLIRLQ